MVDLLKSLVLAGKDVLNPIYDGITTVGPIAISIVLVLSIFYGIFLGVKYSKAETADEKANIQKVLVNFLIGAGIVLVLIGVLIAIREPLGNWINNRS